MSFLPAGTEVSYTITYLEMTDRPAASVPALPPGVTLHRAIAPPVWYFLALYDAVGRAYEWQDRFEQAATDPDALHAYVSDPAVHLWTAMGEGVPQGFFQLDFRDAGVCDLAYFGLVPEAVGKGLGGVLLKTAIAMGWQGDGVAKMSVNTCTLDHPRALALYRRAGFKPVGTEDRTRILKHDRNTATHPQ